MNYKQQANRPYEHANQNLIFHTLDPEEQWCFPRAHLVYAAAGAKRIEFGFPMYQVAVVLDDAEAQLCTVLRGATSVFEEVPKKKGNEKSPGDVEVPQQNASANPAPEEDPPLRVTQIIVEPLQEEIY